MIPKLRSILAGILLAALVAAAPASAAPERTINLSKDSATANWTSAPVTSAAGWLTWGSDFECGGAGADAVDYCDESLVKLTGEGNLDIQLPDTGDVVANEWDLYVYESDAAGTRGAELGFSFNIGGAESVSIEAETGNYLVVAVPFQSVNASYGGAITFTPAETEE